MRSQVEAGSNDAANPSGSGRRARIGVLVTLVAALVFATAMLSSAAADQLPVLRFGNAGTEAGQMRTPGGIAADPTTGDVYVADTGNNRIDKFSAEGTFLLAFGWGVEDGSNALQTCEATCEPGLPGKGAGELNEVVGVAVSPLDGDVYTVNRRDGRVQRFTAAGAFVEQFGGYGAEPGELGQFVPTVNGIAIDSTGQVFVSDPSKGRVAVFDNTGALASEITGVSANAITVGPTGLAYVGNEFSETVSVFEFTAGAWVFKEELALRESFGPRALAINPANGNLLALVSSGFESTFTYLLKEVNAANELVSTTKLPEITKPPAGASPAFGLAASAVPTFAEHLQGAVYVVDQVAGQVQILAEGEPQEPTISGVALANLSTNFADLTAQVNPKGLPTEYFFEYGTTPAYGATFPASGPGHLGASFETSTIGAHLTGLAPSTTYHYKLVARNVDGTVESTDQSFTTFPVGGPVSLPDGRAYEMATPVDKGHNDVEPRGGIEQRGIAGNDEAGMSYVTLNGLPGSETGALLVANVAKRGAGGWTSSVASGREINQTTLATGAPMMIANDMNKALIASKVQLTADSLPGVNIYVHTLSPSSYQLVTRGGYPTFPPGSQNAVGASNDFSHVFFQSNASLTSDSPPGETSTKLYEWDGQTLRNVGILPGESVPTTEGITPYLPELRPVSESGASVVFGVEEPGVGVQVFRRAGGQTVEASASQRAIPDPAGPRSAKFVGAAADGSSVFFTSSGKLTDDAETGETGAGEEDLAPNLYRYDVAGGVLTDLTVDTNGDERGAAVGTVIVAAGGSAAYFVAEGVLAPGGQVNQPNLYRWSQGGGIEFIGILSPSDSLTSGFAPEGSTNASGTAFAFVSEAGLAGRALGVAGIPEIYRYAPGEGLACVSCGLGVMKAGAKMPPPNLVLGSGAGKPLSADGRKVFFTTTDALIPQDTNGKADAYEWEGGVDSLLSTGTGNSNSYFIDASPSGRDAFIATREQLVKSDTDENVDVYDVREGGGFGEPPVEPLPCEAEACRPPLTAAPAAPQISSQSFNGPPNKKKHHKKKHHKKHHKKKHHKGKKHGKKSKSKAHSGGKRG